MLRGVKYNEKIYFSRHRPDSDWFQNAHCKPHGKSNFMIILTFVGSAKRVSDDALNQKISLLKYPGEKRAE